MRLSEVRQSVGHLELALKENPLVTTMLVIAIVLCVLVFGGLLLDAFIEKRRERQKAKALERLHRHLASLPSTKSRNGIGTLVSGPAR